MEPVMFTVTLESACKNPIPRALDLFYQLCQVLAQDSVMTTVEYCDFVNCLRAILDA